MGKTAGGALPTGRAGGSESPGAPAGVPRYKATHHPERTP